jgi:hypothetical protein
VKRVEVIERKLDEFISDTEVEIAVNVGKIRERFAVATAEPLPEATPLETPNVMLNVISQRISHSVDAYSSESNYRLCRCGARISKYTNQCPACKEYL